MSSSKQQTSFKLSSSVNLLAFDLFNLMKDEHPNILFSPMLISTAMSMALLGSDGSSKEELMEHLQFNSSFKSSNDVHKAFRQVIELESSDGLNGDEDGDGLNIANRLVANKGQIILEEYKQALKLNYHSDIGVEDFINGPTVVQKINNWVKEKTKGKITEIIGQLKPETRLVLLNAIYFKGSWQDPFDSFSSHQRIFYGQDGDKKTMFMSQIYNYPYYVNDKKHFQMVEIPYKGPFGFFIVLPDSDKSIEGLPGLELKDLEDSISKMSKKTIILQLPKFTLDEGPYDLKALFSSLGIKDAFSDKDANFSKISGARELWIDEAFHKATIEVNEEGTIATAMNSMRGGATLHTKFVADRPFVFFIRNKATGIIYFMGRLANV